MLGAEIVQHIKSRSALKHSVTNLARGILFCVAVHAGSARAQSSLPRVVKAEPATEWNALFAGAEGWIGGDGVYSTLSADRVLFLFGDTLIGQAAAGRRTGAKMVNNTLGVMDLKSAPAPIRFVYSKAENGEPAAMFKPVDGRGWFWPQAAAELEGRLFVFLAHIEKTDDPGVFGFKQVGQWLAVVNRPLDEPEKWNVELIRIPFAEFNEKCERVWGSALLVDGDYVYVYGIEDHDRKLGSKGLIAARSPLATLAEFDAWEFRTSAGWSKTPEPQGLVAGLANEFSVSRLASGRYLLVYTESGLGDRIEGRLTASPDGPWSEPLRLYTCPEMAADKDLFCYAAKAHSWATEGNELLISYCVNAWQFGRLFEDDTVYRPKFVKVTLDNGP
jgi:hypothetical protein